MASVKAIRDALAERLRPLGNDVQVSAYAPTNPTPPSAFVDLPGPVAYDKTFGRGHDDWTFLVVAIVGGLDRGSQERLDQMIDSHGATSVKALLEAGGATLGGVVESATVVSCSGHRQYTLDTASGTQRGPFVGAEWTVEVLASGVS